jgi:hypothetical protein
MLDLLTKLAGGRAGLTVIGAVATTLIGAGVVTHDSPEGKAFALGAVGVAALGAAIGGPKLLAWWQARQGGGPPAGPGPAP